MYISLPYLELNRALVQSKLINKSLFKGLEEPKQSGYLDC